MNEKLNSAVEVLLEQLREQTQQVLETKRTINALRKRMGEDALLPELQEDSSIASIRPDQYYGRPLATSAQEFLERRKQACLAEDILRGLDQGGFDFKALNWPEKDRLRNLSVSLAKNTKAFHRLPNGTYGLLSWYPEVMKREKDSGREKPAEPDAAAGNDPTK